MKTKRGIYQKGALVLAALSLCVAGAACKIPSGSEGDQPQTTAAPPDPGQAPAGDVVRYAGQEVNDTGQSGVRQAVAARKGADWSSPVVATLYPGTMVTRVARYGNYSLVSWSSPNGVQMGWVDTNLAFNAVRVVVDAGVTAPVVATPTVTTPPTATTAAPPPTTAAPTVTAPPPKTVTPPPPPPKTVTPPPPPPPPKPTTTTTGTGGKIFRPPVIAH